ncbi:prolipoprotein diacylglyceryl transferase [Flavobacteriaceae bacterium]|nr:prolipoprotein diacylglyceryl transferase [Flavobacteriaceae bacterium]
MIAKLFLSLDYFLWEPNTFIFEWNNLKLRWYSLLFALGFILGRVIIFYIYKKEGNFNKLLDIQLIYMFVGTALGSRIGHVIFYNPEIISTNFLELFKFWKGGLSSHGTAFGILISMCFYSYSFKFKGIKLKTKDRLRHGNNYLQVMDRMVIVVALGACFIRIGNFVNSEIVGLPTNSNYGVIQLNPYSDKLTQNLPFVKDISYKKTEHSAAPGYPILNVTVYFKNQKYYEQRIRAGVDRLLLRTMPIREGTNSHVINPEGSQLKYAYTRTNDTFFLNYEAVGVVRHPVQLYESITNFLLFIILFWIWYKKRANLKPGLLLGLLLISLFSMRVFHECFKENQVSFENEMALNMGQLLSIPFIILGIFLLYFIHIRKNKSLL